jgi:hypothetical protein
VNDTIPLEYGDYVLELAPHGSAHDDAGAAIIQDGI